MASRGARATRPGGRRARAGKRASDHTGRDGTRKARRGPGDYRVARIWLAFGLTSDVSMRRRFLICVLDARAWRRTASLLYAICESSFLLKIGLLPHPSLLSLAGLCSYLREPALTSRLSCVHVHISLFAFHTSGPKSIQDPRGGRARSRLKKTIFAPPSPTIQPRRRRRRALPESGTCLSR